MKVVMHGTLNAEGPNALLKDIVDQVSGMLPDNYEVTHTDAAPGDPDQEKAFAEADAIVGFMLAEGWPAPGKMKLWQVPAAGSDRVGTASFPPGSVLCNCFGHEIPIAEYVMASVLYWQLPLVDAFNKMKNNEWYYFSPATMAEQREVYGKTIGILGYGMIGKEVAKRAKAFGMEVLACNLTEVETGGAVDRYFPLEQVEKFASEVDFLSVSLALVDATKDIVNEKVIAGMKGDAVIINVGRAGLIHEEDLYNALKDNRIRGAVLDPQYNYPTADNPNASPTNLDFASLDNARLTSHMSGASDQLFARRAGYVAENIVRIGNGEEPLNIVWQAE